MRQFWLVLVVAFSTACVNMAVPVAPAQPTSAPAAAVGAFPSSHWQTQVFAAAVGPTYLPNGATVGTLLTVRGPVTVTPPAAPAAANPGTSPGTTLSITGQDGGPALSGNNTGGAGSAVTITSGAGGTSSGNAANASGGAISLQGGAAGTGGSGAASTAGNVLLNTTYAAALGNVLIGNTASALAANGYNASAFLNAADFTVSSSALPNFSASIYTDSTSAVGTAITTYGGWFSNTGGTNDNSANTGAIYGTENRADYKGVAPGSLANLVGVASTAAQGGTGTINSEYGGLFKPFLLASGTGVVTNVYGAFLEGTSDFAGGTTAINNYGLYVQMSTGGTQTNDYGIFIDPVTAGGTINDAFLYNGSTKSKLDGAGWWGLGTTTQNGTAELTVSGGAIAPLGGITTSPANSANQACATTCSTHNCIAGFDNGASHFVTCADGTADTCLCGP